MKFEVYLMSSSQENSKIRIKALLKELDRQQLEVRKKKNLIRVIVSVIMLGSFVAFGFAYKQTEDVKSQSIQVKRVDAGVVKNEDLKPELLKVYKLVFDNLNQYPLAHFLDKEKVLSFQEEIKSLHLSKTNIIVDSIDGKERVLAISANYRYYVQVGIFNKQLFSDLPDNMVYLHQIKDKNRYKYRIGPFSKTIQAKKLVKTLKLKDYLIVEVSN